MLKIITALVFVLMIQANAVATVFIPISLETLIEESSAMAEVVLANKESFQNNMGIIQTVHSFEVLESSGLEEEMSKSKYISVTMIGGSFNGLTSYVDGAPEFKIGEKSLLLLKRIEGHLYLSNFSMGKYLIKDQNGQKYYESTVFPKDKDIGLVSKEKMIEIFRSIKHSEANTVENKINNSLVPSDASVISFSNSESPLRDPAANKGRASPLMSFFIFGWLIIMSYVFFPKRRASDRE